jgi:transcriptional regulator with XRE-family HTH domain
MDDMIHTAAEYARVRESVGSQKDVARMLGVDIRTVQRRECGEILITDEAVRALHALSALSYLKILILRHTNREKFDLKEELGRMVTILGNEPA